MILMKGIMFWHYEVDTENHIILKSIQTSLR